LPDRREDMKKILLLLTVLMMFTICFAAEPVAERPVYSAGDYWVFTANDKQEVKLRFLREGITVKRI